MKAASALSDSFPATTWPSLAEFTLRHHEEDVVDIILVLKIWFSKVVIQLI